MANDVPWYLSLIVSFLPLVLGCGAIVWHGRLVRQSMTTRDGRSLAQVFDNHAQEVKRANELREIANLRDRERTRRSAVPSLRTGLLQHAGAPRPQQSLLKRTTA